jgi:D-psicose/D-tagatose/L-ribulose 3-epimerase
VKAVDRPNFGYLYDTFHSNIEENDPIGSIGETIGQIAHVHISENNRGAPGAGHIDLAGAIHALKAVGYDDWMTVEAFGQALPDLAAATKVWRPLFATESDVVTAGNSVMRGAWNG